MTESPIDTPENHIGLVVHPDYQGQADVTWFDAVAWQDRAEPVSQGGRGGAWFIHSDHGEWVLRHYRRGGMMSRLSTSSYFFTAPERTRSVAEFRLLRTLNEMQLPVPVPVAAMYRRVGLFRYQAGIIVERIAGVKILADVASQLADRDWQRLGSIIRRFHDAGVCHADLNSFNVLMRGSDFYLIDFDKCRFVKTARFSQWRRHNLERLSRSLEKVGGSALARRVSPVLLSGYHGSTTN